MPKTSVPKLPAPSREYLGNAAKAAADDLWSNLVMLLEHEDGSRRLTQADVASALGTSEQLVSRWLSGPSNMSIETAGRLAAALRGHLQVTVAPWEDAARGNYFHPYSMDNAPITGTVKLPIAAPAKRGQAETFSLGTPALSPQRSDAGSKTPTRVRVLTSNLPGAAT